MEAVDRVLVIDDDGELCGLVAEYLAPEGFSVESVVMVFVAWIARLAAIICWLSSM